MFDSVIFRKLLFHVLCFLAVGTQVIGQECLSRDYGNGGTVCVCNDEYCDSPPSVGSIPQHSYVTFTSNKEGLRFKKSTSQFRFRSVLRQPAHFYQRGYPLDFKNFSSECPPEIHSEYELCEFPEVTNKTSSNTKGGKETGFKRITINHFQTYQQIFGFGGAFTDATAINIRSLSENLKNYLMNSYFSEDGLDYNLCRVPMAGTDFSRRAYSYVDSDQNEINCVDPTLNNFRLTEEDYNFKIPVIHEANLLTSRKLQLFASTWTAPKAYKENNNYRGTMGFIKKGLYQLWAEYFVKFLDSYLKEGIDFWGLTTGNEPFTAMSQFSGIPGVLWFPDDLGRWIKENLVPTICKSAHKSINIITFDDQRTALLNAVPKILADGTDRHVQGIGLHWYMDSDNNTYLLQEFHKLYPDLFLLATEGCAGDFVNNIRLGAWDRGERYAWDIVQDLNNWVTGWVDWNMVLDTNGGPRVAGPVDAPIIVNQTYKEFYKQPTFYVMGHFSKFIPRGSVRIYSTQCDDNDLTDIVAFRKPDGGTVIIFVNRSDYAVRRIFVDKNKEVDITLTAHSITTILYQ